jgi:hypothetical protein
MRSVAWLLVAGCVMAGTFVIRTLSVGHRIDVVGPEFIARHNPGTQVQLTSQADQAHGWQLRPATPATARACTQPLPGLIRSG